ncbi:MAG: hypothetical protein AAFV29_25710, partial [Myxococcota bacterium]
MWKLWMLGVLAQAAITPEREPSGDNLQVRSAVIGGVDSNAEQSSRNQRAVTAVDVELDLLFERAIGMKTFVDVQAEVDVTWFGGEVDASRATLGAFLAFGRTLMGNAGRKKTERQYPVVEAQVGLGYGLAVRIDGRPEVPQPGVAASAERRVAAAHRPSRRRCVRPRHGHHGAGHRFFEALARLASFAAVTLATA